MTSHPHPTCLMSFAERLPVATRYLLQSLVQGEASDGPEAWWMNLRDESANEKRIATAS